MNCEPGLCWGDLPCANLHSASLHPMFVETRSVTFRQYYRGIFAAEMRALHRHSCTPPASGACTADSWRPCS